METTATHSPGYGRTVGNAMRATAIVRPFLDRYLSIVTIEGN